MKYLLPIFLITFACQPADHKNKTPDFEPIHQINLAYSGEDLSSSDNYSELIYTYDIHPIRLDVEIESSYKKYMEIGIC